FYKGIESLAGAAPVLKKSPLFVVDLAEMTAQYIGGKLEILIQAINQAYLNGEVEKAVDMEKEFTDLALGMDRVLASHPTLRLDRWLAFAHKHGNTPALKSYYERNARRIVTIWGPPVDDYSARIWSGLIRDYYLPRWQSYFETKRTGIASNLSAWERDWVEQKRGVSSVTPFDDVADACLQLIARSQTITPALLESKQENEIGLWSPSDVATDWKELSWTMPVAKLPLLQGVRFQYVRGANKLMIREVTLDMDGVEVCRTTHDGETGTANVANYYKLAIPAGATGNNSCTIRAKVKSDGQCDSFGKVILVLKK
ncbi:MAG: alpha-N-acetylglucosaminidase C-terminal domain-containing protein, partial [Bacteroides sp.]